LFVCLLFQQRENTTNQIEQLIQNKCKHKYKYNQVYLATQLRKNSDGKIVKTPRAVKTLKSNIADETAKKMFLRECLIMVAVGKHKHVVSMVGVAVQQAPWLVVLPFLKSVTMMRRLLFVCFASCLVGVRHPGS
jgi:hypothetical protein